MLVYQVGIPHCETVIEIVKNVIDQAVLPKFLSLTDKMKGRLELVNSKYLLVRLIILTNSNTCLKYYSSHVLVRDHSIYFFVIRL